MIEVGPSPFPSSDRILYYYFKFKNKEKSLLKNDSEQIQYNIIQKKCLLHLASMYV